MADFYNEKVLTIRNKISSNKSLTIKHKTNSKTNLNDLPANSLLLPKTDSINTLSEFSEITPNMLLDIIMTLPNKSSMNDPMPVTLVKKFIDILLPILFYIITKSLKDGVFPKNLKHAIVTPVLKNKNADTESFKNYRPISNLSFVSKLLEKTVLCQLNNFLSLNNLYSIYQSGYRTNHSCETAMLKVTNDIQSVILEKKQTILVSLDLSSAFDTVDHTLLLQRLNSDFRICDKVLRWFNSYLTNRTFSICVNRKLGKTNKLHFGVPQGSLLGPLLYILHTKEIEYIVLKHGLSVHLYADDIQIYSSFHPDQTVEVQKQVE